MDDAQGSAPKPRIVVNQALPRAVERRIEAEFDAPPAPREPLDRDAVIARARDHRPEALLVASGFPVDAALLDAVPDSLKLVATVSVGHDHVALDALRERGIALSNTPDVLTECNADLAFLLILGACRRATEYGALIRNGWGRSLGMNELLGTRVSGKTLGIVGMGRIGRAVARRARGFDMPVLYSNRRRLPAELEAGAEFVPDLRDLLPRVQILTLHLPGGADTTGLIGAAELALLPEGAVLVNAARGSLLDEKALFAALDDGRLAAAGLDVFRNEPHVDRRFATHPRVFATPHMGSATAETREAMGMRALDNVLAFHAGREPPDRVV
ncbi:MAG: D-glycerate dehydrogenase [Gluconacetobacter diazotrophicus]|nr:D-glycerate dehydrogenase [Gluconacetobacter diazotrophicus]